MVKSIPRILSSLNFFYGNVKLSVFEVTNGLLFITNYLAFGALNVDGTTVQLPNL
jgi:hypothetical protein